jgi:AAA domain
MSAVESSGDLGLVVRQADLGRSAPPRWAWENRIVIAYLNLLVGNEGVGKGTLVAWLLARLTRGELAGELKGRPVGVGVLGDEDSFDDVWTPRLHAAGADLSLVVQIERPDGGFVNIREDRDRLVQAATEHKLGVLYFDQLLDNLGAGTDDWRQKAVRDALQPLRSLARELDIATLGCLHPNKRADNFRSLIAGTAAFNAISRSSLLLAEHPDDENLRVLVRRKGNLSQAPAAVEFHIAEHRFNANGHEFKVPLAQGHQVGDLTVDDLVGDDAKTKEHSKVADAAEIIEALLPQDGAWHPAKPIYEACEANDIDDRTVKRAKQRLRLEHRRAQTFPASTEWCWPTRDTHGSSENAVPSVPSVPSANGRNPLRGSSEDTQDRQDSENERPQCVLSACCCADGGEPAADGRCSRCWGVR